MVYFFSGFVFFLDFITKWLALHFLSIHEPVSLTSFFNLYLVFNRGVSFSMLTAKNDWDVYFLIGLSLVICCFIIYYIQKEKDKWIQYGLACVLGGAFGNVWDRIHLGMVVDFLDFHWMQYHFPAFNIADSAISIGVAIMLVRMLFTNRNKKDKTNAN